MRFFFHAFILYMVLFLPAFAVSAEWREYGIPGTNVSSMLFDETLQESYVLGSASVYRSTDKGMTWNAMPPIPGMYPIPGEILGGVFIGDSQQKTLLVATSRSGVYSWDKNSNQWTAVNNGLPESTVSDLSLAGSGRIYLGTWTGLFYSDNQGQDWTQAPISWRDDDSPVECIKADNEGSIYIKFRSSIQNWRMDKDFSSYVNLLSASGFPGQTTGCIIPNPDNPEQLIVSSNSAEIYHSNDHGESWQAAGAATAPESPHSPSWFGGNPIVFSGFQKIYEYDLQHDSWSQIFTLPTPDRYSLLQLGEGRLLLGSQSRGVWRSTDHGKSWKYSSRGMSSYGNIRSIGVVLDQPETLYVGLYRHGVWQTRDDGRTWEETNQGFDVDRNFGISIRTLAVNPADPTHLIAGTEVTHGETPFLYYSNNSGQSWTKIEQGPQATVDSILFVSGAPGVILAGTLGDAIWRSTDNGLSFTRVADPDTFRNISAFAQEKGERIFAGLIAGFERINGYAYSDDLGASWTAVDEYAPGAASALAADPVRPGHIMFGSGSAWMDSGAGVFFSNNNGSSWNSVNEGIPYGGYYQSYDAVDRIIAHPLDSGTYYLLMDYVGVFKTVNEGMSWQQVGSWEGSAKRSSVLELSLRKGGTLFLGTSTSGVLYLEESSSILPGVLMLLLNQ